jgi:hypothetical protein
MTTEDFFKGYYTSGGPTGDLTFQFVLFEGSNFIEIRYSSISQMPPNSGDPISVGTSNGFNDGLNIWRSIGTGANSFPGGDPIGSSFMIRIQPRKYTPPTSLTLGGHTPSLNYYGTLFLILHFSAFEPTTGTTETTGTTFDPSTGSTYLRSFDIFDGSLGTTGTSGTTRSTGTTGTTATTGLRFFVTISYQIPDTTGTTHTSGSTGTTGTTATSGTTGDDVSSGGSNYGIIFGVLGGVIGLVLISIIGGVSFMLIQKKKKKKQRERGMIFF